MNKHKEELIKYRFERAKESLEESKLLSDGNHWNSVANRLYYSVFYAVGALLVKFDLKASSHSGVKSIFNNEFIKTNKLNKNTGILYNKLFNKRQEGDYQDFQYFDRSTIYPLILQVENFLIEIEKVLFD